MEDLDLLDSVLSILRQDADAMKRLRAVYLKRGAVLSYAKRRDASEPPRRSRMHRVWTTYLRLSLADGPAVMQDQLEQALREVPEKDRGGLRRVLLPSFERTMLSDWHQWEEAY